MTQAINYLPPWHPITKHADNLVKELFREVSEGHILWQVKATAIAQRTDSDDVLFEIDSESGRRYAVVHLTWSGAKEKETSLPVTRIFDSLQSWTEESMIKDHISTTDCCKPVK